MSRPVRSAFAVVLSRAPRVLVVQKTNGTWSLPGGGIEEGESPLVAVLRELREETGLSGKQAEFVAALSRRRGRAFLFVLPKRRTRGSLRGSTDEIRRQRWVRPKEALRLMDGHQAKRLEKALPRALRALGR